MARKSKKPAADRRLARDEQQQSSHDYSSDHSVCGSSGRDRSGSGTSNGSVSPASDHGQTSSNLPPLDEHSSFGSMGDQFKPSQDQNIELLSDVEVDEDDDDSSSSKHHGHSNKVSSTKHNTPFKTPKASSSASSSSTRKSTNASASGPPGTTPVQSAGNLWDNPRVDASRSISSRTTSAATPSSNYTEDTSYSGLDIPFEYVPFNDSSSEPSEYCLTRDSAHPPATKSSSTPRTPASTLNSPKGNRKSSK